MNEGRDFPALVHACEPGVAGAHAHCVSIANETDWWAPSDVDHEGRAGVETRAPCHVAVARFDLVR